MSGINDLNNMNVLQDYMSYGEQPDNMVKSVDKEENPFLKYISKSEKKIQNEALDFAREKQKALDEQRRADFEVFQMKKEDFDLKKSENLTALGNKLYTLAEEQQQHRYSIWNTDGLDQYLVDEKHDQLNSLSAEESNAFSEYMGTLLSSFG